MRKVNRRVFIKLLGGSLFVVACRSGPLPLPTPEATPGATPTPIATPTAIPPISAPNQPTPTHTATSAPTATATPAATATPIALTTRITPNSQFYVQTYSGEPEPKAETWTLKVEGLVSKPATFRLNDIKALPAVTQMRTLECIGNLVGGPLIGNTIWKGARFTALAEKIGIKPSASWVVFHSEDDYATSLPLAKLMNPDVLMAYEMGGEPLPRAHGFPVRMLVPGVYGQKQPKWLTRIEFTDHEALGTWEEQGWSREATVNPNGIIEAPSDNQKLEGQTFVVKGVAFAGASGVAKVEVSADKGRTFAPAQILRGPNNFVWTMWAYAWQLPAEGRHTVVVRVTDNDGETQNRVGSSTSTAETFPNGAKSMHAVPVEIK